MDRAEERAKDLCETYDATPGGVPWQAIAKEIRLAIEEDVQAEVKAMRDSCMDAISNECEKGLPISSCATREILRNRLKDISFPNHTLDLALERARLEEHEIYYCTKDVFVFYERGTLPCAPGQSHETGYDHYLCSKEHPCPRRKELDATISALEQAQRESK
jgi:hypothetical protein